MAALTILDAVPDGLLDCTARDLHRVLEGPTLIELPGEARKPLFVSGLMHGNEDSGLGAIQHILKSRAEQRLPRPLMILIGNVAAAREGRRRLKNQPDFNRIWPGAESGLETPEAAIMAKVHGRVVARGAFAAIDIHNNTGRNPHYGVVCVHEVAVLGLAAMFAPRAVLFRGLPGTQTASFSRLIPALTIECGQPGEAANAQAAGRFVEAVLDLPDLPSGKVDESRVDLFHTLVTVRVKPEVALHESTGADWLELLPDLDHHNFHALEAGALFGKTNHPMPLEAVDESGTDRAADFFTVRNRKLRLRQTAIPAMLTAEERIIRQDCLCYLMEKLPHPPSES